MIYDFLEATHKVFGNPVILNDNLVIAPLKPALQSLDVRSLTKIFQVFMSDEPFINAASVLIKQIGLTKMMLAVNGVNRIIMVLQHAQQLDGQSNANDVVELDEGNDGLATEITENEGDEDVVSVLEPAPSDGDIVISDEGQETESNVEVDIETDIETDSFERQ